MKTTAIMIEYLISGILILFALIIFGIAFFPNDFFLIFSKIGALETLSSKTFILIPIFTALAYAFGVLVELFALNIIEWKHKDVKEHSFAN